MKKHDHHVWLTSEMSTEIQRRATHQSQSFSVVVEALIMRGIEAVEAEATERHALPVLREVLGEDQAAALDELRKAICADVRADIVEITSKQTDRLAALQVRVGRSAALTWRLIYRMVQKQFGNAIAEAWYTEARDQAGKAMATKVESGKEIEK